VFAVHVAGSGGIGHSRLVQLSDWLSIVGIMMSPLMSVIAIAVGVHLHKRDSERASEEGRESQLRHSRIIDRLDKIIDRLGKLVGRLVVFEFQLVKGENWQRPERPMPPPFSETDPFADTQNGPPPAAQQPGKESDNLLADPSPSDRIRSRTDAPRQVSQGGRRTGGSSHGKAGDDEFLEKCNDTSASPKWRIRHDLGIRQPGAVASAVGPCSAKSEIPGDSSVPPPALRHASLLKSNARSVRTETDVQLVYNP
jgi:hypothetical protein